ncbi:hypothetical protein OSB04_028533 [Centaurea solstitialis]|uniref:Peroxisomal multifunctional enzyme type 2-like N-terminal domain-containing protein n=1 Tax=Centaurea solstitialis TaxID=347529 RepID=A0AA38W0Q4_9ASTR|nr:hypothetical protein OSB04_028533 [Centaurea solstitialis]
MLHYTPSELEHVLQDALDDKELKYEDGQKSIQVFPTFAALFSIGLTSQLRASTLVEPPRTSLIIFFHTTSLPSQQTKNLLKTLQWRFDPRLLLHGQQYIEIYKPLPSNCSVNDKELISSFGHGHALHQYIQSVKKGPEISLFREEVQIPSCISAFNTTASAESS